MELVFFVFSFVRHVFCIYPVFSSLWLLEGFFGSVSIDNVHPIISLLVVVMCYVPEEEDSFVVVYPVDHVPRKADGSVHNPSLFFFLDSQLLTFAFCCLVVAFVLLVYITVGFEVISTPAVETAFRQVDRIFFVPPVRTSFFVLIWFGFFCFFCGESRILLVDHRWTWWRYPIHIYIASYEHSILDGKRSSSFGRRKHVWFYDETRQ